MSKSQTLVASDVFLKANVVAQVFENAFANVKRGDVIKLNKNAKYQQ